MWTKITHIILKHRVILIVALGLITVFMGYKATQVEMQFKFAELIPGTHPDAKYFHSFKDQYGEDANVLIIGFKDSSIYRDPEVFNRFYELCNDIQNVQTIDSVIAIPRLYKLTPNFRRRKFEYEPFFKEPVASKAELDKTMDQVLGSKFYQGQLFNDSTGLVNILVPIKEQVLNSKRRMSVVADVEKEVKAFSAATGIEYHISGLPYVRSVMAGKVSKELEMFLIMSIIVLAVILWFFFRSFYAVLFPMIVIGVSVVWTMGTMGILGYQISMLTGLIPPIIVVIGIPNCVYLLNKYHQEFNKHQQKIKALSTVLRKIGVVTLITNTTTAIGFLVLVSADIPILREFGIVAGVNVLATFVISIILIPTTFSYLPPPSTKQLKHLNFPLMSRFLRLLNDLVINKRKWVYVVTIVVIVISAFGTWKIKSVAYMVDDIPEDDVVKEDLHFFEKELGGVMPLEIIVESGEKDWYKNEFILNRVDEFQQFLEKQPHLSKPLSMVTFIKGLNQAYYGNMEGEYRVPTSRDIRRMMEFLSRTEGIRGQTESLGNFTHRYMDTTGDFRISVKVADIGSKELDKLIHQTIKPKAEELFSGVTVRLGEDKVDFETKATGTTILFVRGINYLIDNLRQSLLIAIGIISIIMAVLFRSTRMIIISLIPNIIPLLITGALMGYFGIALKPSTALIFSIAFGISVDDSIHYLAKYRQELKSTNYSVRQAVSLSIFETGASMIYTSIILFFGFIIFAGSNFLGTVMLGLLTSTTLLMAMITNLVVLPSLLMTFDSARIEKKIHGLIDEYDQEGEVADLEPEEDTATEETQSNGKNTGEKTKENREIQRTKKSKPGSARP